MSEKASCDFVWFEHMANDLDKAVAFYSAVVGWEIKDSGMPGMRYMMFGREGKDVGGMSSWSAMGESKPARWIGHIYSPDVEAETKAVVADGGRELRPPTTIPGVGSFSVVADPQGAEYMIFQPNQEYAAPTLSPSEMGGVGWRELGTTDIEKAWEFYSSHYGWTKDMAHDMGPVGIYQTFLLKPHTGGGMMNLMPESLAAGAKPGWLFYFNVDDIQTASERIAANGGTVQHGPMQVPGGGWTLIGADSQGAGFGLFAAK